jgi:pimeloyl-ACP methyl ester carboxylesterase
MKQLLFLLSLISCLLINAQISYNNLDDQSGGIPNGYGSWGNNTVIVENEITVAGKGIINFYHPDIAETQLPTVFFISGWGRTASTYEKIFHFIASQGYAVVSIYNTDPGNIVESYQNSLDMMLLSANTHYNNWIDTNKVGLMGHSYGAGSTIWLGKELFGNPHNWGQNGRFIFMSAPWYSLLVTENDLTNYPPNVKLLIEIGNDDLSGEAGSTWNTDERSIRAVFELINIPNSEKDFIRVYSSPDTFQYDSDSNGTTETYTYNASHYISYTGIQASAYETWDALDVYAINRLSHALIDYTFNGINAGKNLALGNGNPAQINMNFLADLEVTDTPIIVRAESDFRYPCSTTWNDFSDGANTWFLQNACADSNGDGIIDLVTASVADIERFSFNLYPVPASDYIQIEVNNGSESIQQIDIFDTTGKMLFRSLNPETNLFNISKLVSGVYFIKIKTTTQVETKRFIVN